MAPPKAAKPAGPPKAAAPKKHTGRKPASRPTGSARPPRPARPSPNTIPNRKKGRSPSTTTKTSNARAPAQPKRAPPTRHSNHSPYFSSITEDDLGPTWLNYFRQHHHLTFTDAVIAAHVKSYTRKLERELQFAWWKAEVEDLGQKIKRLTAQKEVILNEAQQQYDERVRSLASTLDIPTSSVSSIPKRLAPDLIDIQYFRTALLYDEEEIKKNDARIRRERAMKMAAKVSRTNDDDAMDCLPTTTAATAPAAAGNAPTAATASDAQYATDAALAACMADSEAVFADFDDYYTQSPASSPEYRPAYSHRGTNARPSSSRNARPASSDKGKGPAAS
ncbi:hypothetical protein SYNPS1DRAFT_29939 [Syncephalis pseudoplumigaleata]|uniref:Uncharacterized protein n=1 Tax=Syncephalis pseudoplumigaleata TaxID=1712513 RepID=A0A4P9YW62_9FUNG|nr:hypothetical protein SYNPS1DRAFT_29939 [Syncephalis pseudoplumigaleata]|eukprot:RKP24296.1 hypothetical protein SYNPS1DRAFT_29939 [Syncephalis pseudoplumigaleata]